MAENKESVDGKYLGIAPPTDDPTSRAFFEMTRENYVPGAFYYTHGFTDLCVVLPGQGHFSKWAIRPNKLHNGHSWLWDGNLEKPTFLPSLNLVGWWHGHLTSGRFKSC